MTKQQEFAINNPCRTKIDMARPDFGGPIRTAWGYYWVIIHFLVSGDAQHYWLVSASVHFADWGMASRPRRLSELSEEMIDRLAFVALREARGCGDCDRQVIEQRSNCYSVQIPASRSEIEYVNEILKHKDSSEASR